jgi:hypothetical protein
VNSRISNVSNNISCRILKVIMISTKRLLQVLTLSRAKVFVLVSRERQFHSICKYGFNKLDIPMFEELVKITKYMYINEKIVLVSTEHRSDLQVVNFFLLFMYICFVMLYCIVLLYPQGFYLQ